MPQSLDILDDALLQASQLVLISPGCYCVLYYIPDQDRVCTAVQLLVVSVLDHMHIAQQHDRTAASLAD